jgi:hypothetical protein
VIADEVAKVCGYDVDTVVNVLSAFALPDGEKIDSFNSLHWLQRVHKHATPEARGRRFCSVQTIQSSAGPIGLAFLLPY